MSDLESIAVDVLVFSDHVLAGNATELVTSLGRAHTRDAGPYLLLSFGGAAFLVSAQGGTPGARIPGQRTVTGVPCNYHGPDCRSHHVDLKDSYSAGILVTTNTAGAVVAAIQEFYQQHGRGPALTAAVDQWKTTIRNNRR